MRGRVDRKELLEMIQTEPGIHADQLANTFGVGKVTISNNVRKLREDGYTITSTRSGYFASEDIGSHPTLSWFNRWLGTIIGSYLSGRNNEESMLQRIRDSEEWRELPEAERKRVTTILRTTLEALEAVRVEEMIKSNLLEGGRG